MDLELELADRIQAKDRFKSAYVESIKDDEKKFQNLMRATEYWAEICAQYFDNRSKLSVTDVMLVETVIKKNDPEYNFEVNKQKRDEILKKAKK